MTTNQTIDDVPRRLMDTLMFWLVRANERSEADIPELKELSALLDAPAPEFSAEGWVIDHSAGRPILVHNNCSVIEAEQAYGLLELIKAAAQPHGEPVAWQFYQDGKWWNGDDRIKGQRRNTVNAGYKVRDLYADQPAPVSVVLPERLDLPHRDEFESADQHAAAVGEAKSWNACLDEWKRLNPAL